MTLLPLYQLRHRSLFVFLCPGNKFHHIVLLRCAAMSSHRLDMTDTPTTAVVPFANDPNMSAPGLQRHPCLLCQQRKVKCDRKTPCSNCVKFRADCLAPRSDLPAKRKRRFPEAELLARIRRYETYFRENGLDPEAIGHASKDPQSSEISAGNFTRYTGLLGSNQLSTGSLTK